MNELCFECSEIAEHLHHVVPKCLGGTKTIPLCKHCHKKVHSPESSLSFRKLPKRFYRSKVTLEIRKKALELKGKMSIRKAATVLGVSHDSIWRIWKGTSSAERLYEALAQHFE